MENIPIDLNVREDKPAFNIDRLLSIHQSYSLEGIKRLNVEMLKAQYAQCEQLTQLQKQIDQGNKISMQILRNQIREIENRERQKFYKAMVFNLAMFCDHIRLREDRAPSGDPDFVFRRQRKVTELLNRDAEPLRLVIQK